MNSSKLDSNLIVFYLIEEKEACSKVLTEGVFIETETVLICSLWVTGQKKEKKKKNCFWLSGLAHSLSFNAISILCLVESRLSSATASSPSNK